MDNNTKSVLTGSVEKENLQNRRAVNKNENINYDLFLDSLLLAANMMKNSTDFKAADKVLFIFNEDFVFD